MVYDNWRLFMTVGGSTLGFWAYYPSGDALFRANGQSPVARQVVSGGRLNLSVAPNPVHATTTISYYQPAAGRISVKLYDVTGKLVTRLVSGYHDAGTSSFTVHRSSLSSGIYLLRLDTDIGTVTRKVVVR